MCAACCQLRCAPSYRRACRFGERALSFRSRRIPVPCGDQLVLVSAAIVGYWVIKKSWSVSVILSAMHTYHPSEVVSTAAVLESLGFARFWASEHYTRYQSASPAIMSAIAASRTTAIRIGAGAVLLRYAQPLRVASDFHLLEALYPGRVDLGIAGGIVGDPRLHTALSDFDSSFEDRATSLVGFLRGGPFDGKVGVASASGLHPPRLWVCGSSVRSADLAARLGAGFAFRPNIVPTQDEQADCPLACYRRNFRADRGGHGPEAIVVCFGACAESQTSAERWWEPFAAARPGFLGEAAACAEQLERLRDRYDVTEIMVQCMGPALDVRMSAYAALAEQCS